MNSQFVLGILFSSLVFLASCGKSETADPGLPEPPLVANPKQVVLNDSVNGAPIVVIGYRSKKYMVAYSSILDDGTHLLFEPDTLTNLSFKDETGGVWDLFGNCTSGTHVGQKLKTMQGNLGYFFSWGAMYPGFEVYNFPDISANGERQITQDWLIPRDDVWYGAPKDAIPALVNPEIVSQNDPKTNFLANTDLVVGVHFNGEYVAYPHNILDWHEIVNDDLGSTSYAVIYCPLTGTATVWDRNTSAGNSTFGVSGLLYNSNIIPYDRKTGSNWSQMLFACVNGSLITENSMVLPSIETTWGTWKEISGGNTKVMSTNTGHQRNYNEYPYGDYKTNHNNLLFPLQFEDTRLNKKERILGVTHNGSAKGYRFSTFQ